MVGFLLLVLCDNEHILTCKPTYVNCYYYFIISNCHEQWHGNQVLSFTIKGVLCNKILSTNLQAFDHSLVLQSQVCYVYGNVKHSRQQYIQFILFEMQLMISNILVYHTYSSTCLKFMVVLLCCPKQTCLGFTFNKLWVRCVMWMKWRM